MSDINNLPDQFETFAQARKNGFLAAKEVKDSGKKNDWNILLFYTI